MYIFFLKFIHIYAWGYKLIYINAKDTANCVIFKLINL